MTTSRNPSTRGTLYCVLSSAAYTLYYVCLRNVSDKNDPAWINCVQASVGAAVFGLYLVYQSARGHRALPPWKELLALAAVGFITQVGGVLLIWAMSVIGVGITSTLQTGMMLAASAVLGLAVLGERVTWKQVGAILLITVSVIFFSMESPPAAESGTGQPHQPAQARFVDGVAAPDQGNPPNDAATTRILGIAAAILAGVAFAILTVGTRKAVTSATSPEAVVFLINAMAMIVFGPWCVYRLGIEKLLATSAQHLGLMLGAGVFNLAGFLLITMSLQLITVVRVNVISNAFTTALTVAAGIVLFQETCNSNVAIAFLLSGAGILLISVASSPQEASSRAGDA